VETSGAAMLVGMLAGESPVRGTYPVATVVISGDGAGDQSAESPETGGAFSEKLRRTLLECDL